MNKTCVKCKLEKSVLEFYKAKALRKNDDGYDYYCKKCRNWALKKTYHTNKVKCTMDNCKKPHYALGMCKVHYNKKKLENIKTFHDMIVDPQGKYKEW